MIPIKTIMTTDVVTATPETPIYEALSLLAKHRVSGLPVINSEQNVIGILSEKDVLKILLDAHPEKKKIVEDYMSTEVTTFCEDDSAVDVCKFFMKNHMRRVPIVRDGKLVGIASRRDIVSLILEAKTKMGKERYV